MKLWHILSGITLSVVLTGATFAVQPSITAAEPQAQFAQPTVTGTVNVHQRIALPPNAALTVTVSDASVSDVTSKVIVQNVAWTEGKQAPFTFTLPYNPADIQPNARILLSAAVTIDNRVVMVTQNFEPVITNGINHAELTLIPVESVSLPTKSQGSLISHPAEPVLTPAG